MVISSTPASECVEAGMVKVSRFARAPRSESGQSMGQSEEGAQGKGASPRAKEGALERALDRPGSAPRLLTMRQAAEALAVSYWTVRTWVESGKLRAVRLPGQRLLRIEVMELARFVEQHRDS